MHTDTAIRTTPYGYTAQVALDPPAAIAATREALATEGFGILTEIDVQATLRKKLDVEVPPYVILGACNPAYAHRALAADRNIGLLLPCNVVVYEGDRPGTSVVGVLDPVVQLGITGRKDIEPIAADVKARMLRALAALTTTTER